MWHASCPLECNQSSPPCFTSVDDLVPRLVRHFVWAQQGQFGDNNTITRVACRGLDHSTGPLGSKQTVGRVSDYIIYWVKVRRGTLSATQQTQDERAARVECIWDAGCGVQVSLLLLLLCRPTSSAPREMGATVSITCVCAPPRSALPRHVLNQTRVGTGGVQENQLHNITNKGLEVLNPDFQLILLLSKL